MRVRERSAAEKRIKMLIGAVSARFIPWRNGITYRLHSVSQSVSETSRSNNSYIDLIWEEDEKHGRNLKELPCLVFGLDVLHIRSRSGECWVVYHLRRFHPLRVINQFQMHYRPIIIQSLIINLWQLLRGIQVYPFPIFLCFNRATFIIKGLKRLYITYNRVYLRTGL